MVLNITGGQRAAGGEAIHTVVNRLLCAGNGIRLASSTAGAGCEEQAIGAKAQPQAAAAVAVGAVLIGCVFCRKQFDLVVSVQGDAVACFDE